MNELIEDFDDIGLRIEGSDEIQFKDAVMLVCRWWYPTKEAPTCVVDAIHVTRAEPTTNGVRVTSKLQLIAKPVSVDAGNGVKINGQSVTCAFEGADLNSALRKIESGIDPLFERYKADEDTANALTTHVEALSCVYQQSDYQGLIKASEHQKPPPRL